MRKENGFGKRRKPGVLRRAVIASAVTAALAAAAAAYAVLALRRGGGLPCPLRALTGLLCPGCGMTHAAADLLRLNIRDAFSDNMLFPLYIAYFGWLIAAVIRRYIRTGEISFPLRPFAVHAVTLTLALGYGILRNIL